MLIDFLKEGEDVVDLKVQIHLLKDIQIHEFMLIQLNFNLDTKVHLPLLNYLDPFNKKSQLFNRWLYNIINSVLVDMLTTQQ